MGHECFESEFDKQVAEAGGMEEYYKQKQKAHLEKLRQELVTERPPSMWYSSKDALQHMIGNIEALFAVYELLLQADVPASFVGLTHTMQRYPMSVIRPMKELLEQGKVEEALALYHQPRPYCR